MLDPAIQLISDRSEDVAGPSVLPFVVTRRAGVSIGVIRKLVFTDTLGLIDQYLDLEAFCRSLAGNLLSALHRVIGEMPSGPRRQDLIGLRRDIFNDRLPKDNVTCSETPNVPDKLSEEERTALETWLDCRRRRETLIRSGEGVFGSELSAKRSLFKRSLRKREFCKALALASPQLWFELQGYLQRPQGDAIACRRRTERSLMRYYSRCALKLSPFSSFTRTSLISTHDASANYPEHVKPPWQRIRRRVTINQTVIAYLADYAGRHTELGDYVPISLSRSVVEKEGTLLILRHKFADPSPKRMRIPEEAFVNIVKSRAIEQITEFLTRKQRPVPRGELISTLCHWSNDQKQASSYVENLINMGFLVHKVPLAEDNSDGFRALEEFLTGIDSPIAVRVAQSLEKVRALVLRFSSAAADERPRLILSTEAAVDEAFRVLGVQHPPKWDGLLLYEDCVETPVRRVSQTHEIFDKLGDLKQFLSSHSTLLDGNSSARETIRHVLQTEFSGGPVSFLHFAERYHKVCFATPLAQLNPASGYTPNPCHLDSLEQLAELRREFSLIVTQSCAVDEIDLRRVAEEKRWVARIQKIGLAKVTGSVVCFSSYCQFGVDDEGGHTIILNKLHGGPLRAALRFYNNLPRQDVASVIPDIRRVLQTRIWKQGEPCELLAEFDFNINIHPSVTERAINYANDLTQGSRFISLSNIYLTIGIDGEVVVTDGAAGRQIIPVNFGMMATPFEPPLEYLLLSLGTADPVLNKPFDPYSWKTTFESQGKVTTFPRLRFGNCVIRRRAWSVSKEALPQRNPQETDFTYILRIRRWQREVGLPDEVFVRARTLEECISEAEGRIGKRNRTLHKPQYIHFGNWFLVSVLADLLGEVVSHLYVEEVLPDWSALKKRQGERPLECVFDVCVDSDQSSAVDHEVCETPGNEVACESCRE